MTDQHAYDAIAERYRESKWLLFRHYIRAVHPVRGARGSAGPDGAGSSVRRRGLHAPVQAGRRGGGDRRRYLAGDDCAGRGLGAIGSAGLPVHPRGRGGIHAARAGRYS